MAGSAPWRASAKRLGNDESAACRAVGDDNPLSESPALRAAMAAAFGEFVVDGARRAVTGRVAGFVGIFSAMVRRFWGARTGRRHGLTSVIRWMLVP